MRLRTRCTYSDALSELVGLVNEFIELRFASPPGCSPLALMGISPFLLKALENLGHLFTQNRQADPIWIWPEL
jgi:hypothetical protein